MTGQAQQLLDDMQAHAVRRGWAEVENACDSLRRAPTRQLLLLLAEDVDAEQFLVWARSQANGYELALVPLAGLARSPLLDCERTASLFATASVPSAEALAAHARLEELLPQTARGVVLLSADSVSGDAELDPLRRMAWGLFVAEPKPVWDGQSLQGKNIHFWPGSASSVQSLAEFLFAPPRAAEHGERQRRRVAHVLVLAQKAAALAVPDAHDGREAAARAIDVDGLERRLRTALHEELEQLRRSSQLALRARLQTVQGQLLRLQREAAGAERSAQMQTAVDEAWAVLRTELDRCARSAAYNWSGTVEQAANRFLGAADAGPSAAGNPSLGQSLALSADVPPDSLRWSRPADWRPPLRAPQSVIVDGAVVCGSAAVGAFLMGVSGAGLGAAVGLGGRHLLQAAQINLGLQQWESTWAAAVNDAAERIKLRIARHHDQLEDELEQRIAAECAQLRARPVENRDSSPAQQASAEDAALLDDWYKRMDALTTEEGMG